MEANINNITYTHENGKYHIITEFSVLPLETFDTEQEAVEFIEGYLYNIVKTEANRKGELFRNFVEIDLRSGVKYNKVREIDILMSMIG